MSENEMIAGLGTRGDYVAPVPNVDPVRLRLTEEELRLLAGIGRVARIGDLVARSGLDEARAIALLLALRAKGAIVPARYQAPAKSAPVDAALAEEVDLPADRKQEILDLDRALDGLDYFELLGVLPGAEPDVVKKAYYEASKRFHPDRFYGRNIGSFRGRLERIFRHISEAERTLTDPARRAEYLKANPQLARAKAAPLFEGDPEPAAPAPPDPQRESERRAWLARHPYLLKTARLNELLSRARASLQKNDAAMALTDLQAVLQIDGRHKEALALQAEARRLHELGRANAELRRAEELERSGDTEGACHAYRLAAGFDQRSARANYRAALLMARLGQDAKEIRVLAQRAVDVEPQNADHHVLLAKVLLEAGMKKLAQRHFEEALKLNPDHSEARKHKKTLWPF